MRQEVSSAQPPHPFGDIHFSAPVDRCIARFAGSSATLRQASARETDEMLSAASNALRLAPPHAVHRVRTHNPETIRVIEARGRVIGYLAYLPLNENGLEALLEARFTGLEPDTEQLCRAGERPQAIYLWLVYAPGALGRGLALVAEAYRRLVGEGVPVFTRSVTEHSVRLTARMGFLPARSVHPAAPEWLLVALPNRPLPLASRAKPPPKILSVRFARDFEDMMKIVAVRSATYLAEQFCLYDEEFDGNDLCATQFLGEIDGDPAGCVRLRYFGDFAKLERLAVRKEYRKSKLAFALVRAALAHCADKGFSRVYGHSRADLVRFWRTFGFREMADRPRFAFADLDYREIMLELKPCANAIQLGVDPMVSIRPEGAWDRPGPLDLSNLRQDPARAALLDQHTRKLKERQ